MAFTAQDVKELREKTGCGMMDCKNALKEADGNMEKAVEILREKGIAKQEKKMSRIAADGLVTTYKSGDVTAMIEVNSETDFVAKNPEFQAFVNACAKAVAEKNPADVDALLATVLDEYNDTAENVLRELILKIGEKMTIRRFARLEGEVAVYIHGGGSIGVLAQLEVSDNLKGNPEVYALGKDIGMQSAAMRPSFLDKSQVDDATLAKEKEILLAQALNEVKPQQIAEKMVMGRINKYYEENCLLQQAFVKENKISVEKHIAAVAKVLGGEIKLVNCIRFEKGEGIEKRQDDFAAEVAAMAK